MSSSIKQKSYLKSRPVRVSLLLVVAVIVVLGVLEIGGITHFFHKKYVVSNTHTAGQSSKGDTLTQQSGNAIAKGSTPTSTPAGSGGSEPGDDKSTSGGGNTNTVAPETPTGDFVSNHHPNLSGAPAPNSMSSTCNTTPGATCQVVFTSGTVTKSLPATATDRGGAAYWSGWTLQSVGLTTGSWQVQAVATLNGKTAVATDAQVLDVEP